MLFSSESCYCLLDHDAANSHVFLSHHNLCKSLVSSTNPGILSRRYFLVQKAKEARTVGILVGTLGAGKCSSFCCVCAQCIIPSLINALSTQ